MTVGGRSRPSAVRAAWILGDGDGGIIPASFDGVVDDAVGFEAHRLMSRCAYLRLTLRASGGWKSLYRDDPISDVSKSPCRHHPYGPSRRAALKPARPSSQRMNPVKGTYCLERRRLQSYSDTNDASVFRGLLRTDLECSV